MGQLNNLQLSADCIGNGGALTLKNPDMSVSVGCPSDMVLDNSTGGAERCCKIYHVYCTAMQSDLHLCYLLLILCNPYVCHKLSTL